jgi:hypothetical protein
VGIPPDIIENLGRPGERPLCVDDPLSFACRNQMAQESHGLMEALCLLDPRAEDARNAAGRKLA